MVKEGSEVSGVTFARVYKLSWALGCGYTVITDDSCKRILEVSKVEHTNHKKYSDEEIAKQQFKVRIKRKAVENLTEKPSKIIRKSLKNSEESCDFNNK